jgi:hypothetical protein
MKPTFFGHAAIFTSFGSLEKVSRMATIVRVTPLNLLPVHSLVGNGAPLGKRTEETTEFFHQRASEICTRTPDSLV